MAAALITAGFALCVETVRRLLHAMGVRPRANAKTLHGPDHPDRDAQFKHIEKMREMFAAEGQPIISVDAKKRELIGNFKNQGQTWTKEVVEVNDHDFPHQADAKVTPYGIYDVTRNEGTVVLGESANTAEFAVSCVVKWWIEVGKAQWPGAKKVLILADGGGSNGWRVRMWKLALQYDLADAHGLEVYVCHYPPGTSKWNPVEHRLFGPISNTWAGIPLRSVEVMMDCVEKTRTKTGLRVRALRLRDAFERGVSVSKDDMASLDLQPDTFSPNWNYALLPA
jgi:hypothetical protein